MKALFSKVGEILLIIIAIPLGAILLIASLPVVLVLGLREVIGIGMALLRKDPKHNIPKHYRVSFQGLSL